MTLIRQNAARWRIHPDRIGIMGSSAGGHLASTVSTRHYRTPAADPAQSKPNFTVLVYPVISTGPVAHRVSIRNLLGSYASGSLLRALSNEKQVTALTPPTLLLRSTPNATVPVENTLLYFEALK